MKITKLFVIILIFFSSCKEELPDPIAFSRTNADENIFVAPDGQSYYTGVGDCEGGPSYSVSDNVVESLEIPDVLPESYDLSEFLPPVRSQGSQGSCVSWAVGYYMKSMQEKIQNGYEYGPETIMSPAYTYNQIAAGDCRGTSIETTLLILKEKGICSLSSFPYNQNSCALQPTSIQDEVAANAKISDFKSLSGENMVLEMKALLLEKTSVIISAALDNQFGVEDEFGLTAYREHEVDYENAGCHAMLVVGYSDEFNAFKVVNSWGPDWGDDGFVWIDYKAFDNVLDEDASFRVINTAHIAIDE
ncbi:hypothetical protein GTQ40_16790 [Flavobacteriaceae bacterium R38]|nr:hypothetical protein [Flavobacteriaceae bacterium R38]